MKKIIILISLLFSLSMADSTLLIKKGWQLIGSSVSLQDMSKFSLKNVEQVWHFDATTQTWLGYSPDSTIQKKIEAQNIGTLSHLKSWHGFWIKSKEDWTMVFEDKILSSQPVQATSSDVIELKKGWNLISLPIDTVVSPDIFKGMTTWKYNDTQWELANNTVETSNIPKLGHIKNSDGIWLKANEDKNISIIDESLKLHNFNSDEEILTFIKERASIDKRLICGIEPFNEALTFTAEVAVSADTASNTSSTNLQESDVDESDILKHNDKYIFYVGKENDKRGHINVTSFEDLTKKSKSTLATISLDESQNIDSFYLTEDKLTVLSMSYDNQVQTFINVFDISDINNIKNISETIIDGSLKNSRVINNNLYLISSFYPQYDISYPKEYLTISSPCEDYVNGEITTNSDHTSCYGINKDTDGYFRYNYDEPDIKTVQLLPKISSNTLNSQTLVTPTKLFASSKQEQSTTITSISNFSIDDGTYLQSTSYIGNSAVEYASSNSLYLVSNDYPFFYDFNNYKSRSQIYKFDFDANLSYKAVGSVYGTTLNQFSLSEHESILRIATTEGFSWGNSVTKNTLYTLKENNKFLNIEGTLSGLGKEGETIKSVRFIDTKAYLVTFRTTDPLYTIDLSNPKAPKKMGELEVNGYSAYLHPIGDDKLLGIGQDSDESGVRQGVKIELFDISDFENPSSLDSITLDQGTHSELETNHKALAYRPIDNLFAFPFSNYASEFNNYQRSNHLGIYQVDNDSLKSYEGLEDNNSDWGEHRGLIFDLNNTTYVSFFSQDSVITKELTTKEN
ncbi:MAG: Unknown protein [uncultured Sulfurovum sp.]|uniref:Beta propeller domain-containing protein n=1 Tax=uncultured Sulfurovum sp. TaxID=269237 RepID=A0A6S6S5T6_9BACT|nr:MAG: Unknown protein [uncultured Sulfurovum sp.]